MTTRIELSKWGMVWGMDVTESTASFPLVLDDVEYVLSLSDVQFGGRGRHRISIVEKSKSKEELLGALLETSSGSAEMEKKYESDEVIPGWEILIQATAERAKR